MYKSKTPITVQYYETDRMGVVHHSNYFRYFETARGQFLDEINLPYKQCEERGIFSPVLSICADYKKSCTYMDKITVVCFIKEIRKLRIIFGYEVLLGDDQIATGESSHTFVNKNLRPINVKKDFPDVYQAMERALEE